MLNIAMLTVHLTDGIKITDYAPNRVYDLTAVLENPQGDDLDKAISYLSKAGEKFLGRSSTTAKVETTAAPPKEPADAKVKPAAKTTKAKPPVKDPMDLGDDGGSGPMEGQAQGGAADPMSLDDAGADFNAPIEPEPSDAITDEDLNEAAQAANTRSTNPNAIRALIASYNPDKTKQFQLRQIPADKRADFVAKLKDEKVVPKLGA